MNIPNAAAAMRNSAKPRMTSVPTPNTVNNRADSYAGDADCSEDSALICRGRLAAASGVA